MKRKTLQIFSKEQLDRDRNLTPQQIAQFLEDFRQLSAGNEGKRKLISLRVPERLLKNFKAKADRENFSYQTQIVELMRKWVKD